MPKPTESELALQGIEIGSLREVMDLINSKKLIPQNIEITEGILDPPFYQEFNMQHTKTLGSKLKFSDVKIGKENNGYLRKEDPIISFPIEDDIVETDSFHTHFDIWQFEGIKGQKIDLLVRSLSTFPVGMFLPYFILLQDNGHILARQAHILTLDKEKIKSWSIMVWIKDYIIQETGTYYVIVLADNHKEEDPLTWDPEIRLNNDRISLKSAFQNEGWIMFADGDYFDPDWEKEPMPNLFYDPNIQFGRRGDITQGKYNIILWSSME
jgi:hypothetical protein